MEATPVGQPYLATLLLFLEAPPARSTGNDDVWDDVMEVLVRHPGIIDPVISNDLDRGQVSISFEFEATGNAHQDGLAALNLLTEATRAAGPASAVDWDQWLGGPSSAGTVQYPVYA